MAHQLFCEFALDWTGSVLLIVGSTLLRMYMTGVLLPGWFLACIFAGILGPWVVALHVAGRQR